MSHPQDPSFESTARYDRDQVIAIVSVFYRFLAEITFVGPDDVLFPPPCGWPNINKERFAALGENDEVVDLLAHLPYINMSGPEYMVAPSTYPIDYRGDKFQSALEKGVEECEDKRLVYSFPYEFPPWVVLLTMGILYRDYLMLDTSDGA